MTDVNQIPAIPGTEETGRRERRDRREPREKREPRPPAKVGEIGESRVVALVVVGDRNGRVGLGYGKAKEVPLAIQKGTEEAKRNIFHVALAGTTITHATIGVNGAGRVMLKPAAPGCGVIAGGAARIILEEAGIKDVLAKVLGSPNAINVARATINGLKGLQRPDEVAKRRGLPAEDFVPKGMLRAYTERKKTISSLGAK
ncbi:MAG: ribosomal protein [Actinomycetota bacterium]